jgi:hypothetical protein
MLQGNYEITQASKQFNLSVMLSNGFFVLDELVKFVPEILYSPQGSFFLTSDSPVFTVLPDATQRTASFGTGFGWPGVEVYFPLNKRACLRLRKGGLPRSSQLSEKGMNKVNDAIMMFASQYLYSCQGYKRIARLFDERGCKIRPGRDSFRSRFI